LNLRFLSESLLGALLGFLIILASSLIIRGLGGFVWARNAQVDLSKLLLALAPFLAVSVYEELVFRGYAFQRAVRGMGETLALLLFCLFFVVAHWNNPGMVGGTRLWACLNIALASLLLGLAYLKTKSLALPMGIHLGWNWTQGALLGFGVSGAGQDGYWTPVFGDLPQWLTGGEFGLEASLPCALVCAAACIALALWGKGIAKRKWLDYNVSERG